MGYPVLMNPVLDGTDIGELAEFYRQLLGLRYAPGHEPVEGEAPEWLVLRDDAGRRVVAFQKVDRQTRTTWPSPDVPMQAHLCFEVEDADDLVHQKERAEALGAELLLHRTDEPAEPLFVLADPAGHPFCLLSQIHSGE